MKQHSFLFKLLSVILAFCFALTSAFSGAMLGFATDDEFEGMTPEEKQAAIEQRLKEVNDKLAQLGEESQETEEYINTLDEKIKYLKSQLSLAGEEIENSKTEIKSLEKQFQDNEEEIAQTKVDIEKLTKKNKKLQTKFDKSYDDYCQRLRAMYVSGETSVLVMIITSPDISTLLTRLEMIKRVAQTDTALLNKLQEDGKALIDSKTAMEEKQKLLNETQEELVQTQKDLEFSVANLQNQQVDYKEKQTAYETEKAESDEKLKELQEQQNTYSEYRNQDQAELEAVNAEIAAAAEAFRKKMEAQQATTQPTTTEPPTITEATTEETTIEETTETTQPVTNELGETVEQETESTTQATTKETTTQTTTQATTHATNALHLTYPIPSQTKITCAYGSEGYAGHTGVDFSCDSGSTVVAAESGYVFYVKYLDYSYGYHLLIMHDKKDSAGNYVYTLYAHNSSIVVSEGQYVSKGQTIAYSGSTGNSTGPHCHFEVRTPTADYSCCVNPTIYLW